MQIQNYQTKKITTSIDFGYQTDKDRIEAFRNAVEGQTFFNFRVLACPAGGSLHVTVETDYDFDGYEFGEGETPESEVATYVASLLAF